MAIFHLLKQNARLFVGKKLSNLSPHGSGAAPWTAPASMHRSSRNTRFSLGLNTLDILEADPGRNINLVEKEPLGRLGFHLMLSI
jgi:hypothetical protein